MGFVAPLGNAPDDVHGHISHMLAFVYEINFRCSFNGHSFRGPVRAEALQL